MSGRIAILAHSVNPRGGVVHAMHLAEALREQGADATLLVPALRGEHLFRTPRCPAILIPAGAGAGAADGTAAAVARRIAAVRDFLSGAEAPRFDLHHAQDPITGNALADLVAAERIAGFVRTVHHLDRFADPLLAAWQERAVREAAVLCCVSRHWGERVAAMDGRAPVLVGNGVDRSRFTPVADGNDAALRARLGLPPGPVLLALGGVETRKNTVAVLRAFLRLRDARPDARLLVAGGATLLDHGAARDAFAAVLRESGAGAAVTLAGVIPDAEMPALYRLADVVVSPSRAEGFGLVPIEAMACGRPAIVSAIAPFTEHLEARDCLWADPDDVDDIARAMRTALDPQVAARLGASGPRVAARFDWGAVARAHQPAYARMPAAAGRRGAMVHA